jgi:hypothetical protein
MKIAVISSTFLLLVGSSQIHAQVDGISRDRVERVITVLSADDMEGRGTFTPGIDRAADFLAEEFQEIGLSPLDGNHGFLQAFNIFSLTTESSRVLINGSDIPVERFATSVSVEEISWTGAADYRLEVVGPGDDFRATFFSLRSGEENVLLLVDEAHADFFGRIKQFMARPTRQTELGGGPNTVMVLTTETQITSVDIRITNNIEEQALANVAGIIPGRRSDEIVLFSAHYDHLGIRPAVEGDSIANGANDDASGTAAVVELARHFNSMGRPERTLMFVAFTAEEMGGFGSTYFSQQLDPDQIVAMFNIEMIGKPATDGPNTAWITGFDRSDFGEILQGAVEGTVFSFYADPYPDQNLFYRSDNATLARLGVPAHSISTTPIDVDADYHQVSDEVETLDLEHLTNTIRAIAAGAKTIVDGDATPTRVDPEDV